MSFHNNNNNSDQDDSSANHGGGAALASKDDDTNNNNNDNKSIMAASSSATPILCFVMFTHSYLLISVFPYSGFMALELIDSATPETAGSYAGWISAAFFIGRVLSSASWGLFADAYGRKVAMQACLAASVLFSLLFGLSSNFYAAVTWRWGLGLVNNLMIVLKVIVSELAGDDEELETQTMNQVMSMWGVGVLLAPSISGALAEPTRQYNDWTWLQQYDVKPVPTFLEDYPFFLPNVVGAIFCIASALLIQFLIPETLPKAQLRSAKYIPRDFLVWLGQRLGCGDSDNDKNESNEEKVPLKNGNATRLSYLGDPSTAPQQNKHQHDNHQNARRHSSIFDGLDKETLALLENETVFGDLDALSAIEEDVRDAGRRASELVYLARPSAAVFSERGRASIMASLAVRESAVLAKRLSVANTGSQRKSVVDEIKTSLRKRRASSLLIEPNALITEDEEPPMSVGELWAQDKIRKHLLCYAGVMFMTVALEEAFPLFALSSAAGLGLEENFIGAILSVSGLLYTAMQLLLFSPLVDWIGLMGSVRLSVVVLVPTALLVPVALVLNKGSAPGGLSYGAFAFLVINMAFIHMIEMTFMTGMSIAFNRLVPPSQRGTMNGLSNLICSCGQGFGPIFAGLLVALSFTIVGTQWGALFLFGVMAFVVLLIAIMTYALLGEDQHEEDEHLGVI
mmetsp:Transcript_4081/g.8386  ORF Transcript_4081/g.8386 Transcript_4081/m.8386 type:complete len:683 (-) Transcript_4081:200-2248(-)|eukprot:CAMPEP_0168726090 /NCGR_PEP_ID=MMETSP0724-20121128/4491_1 /TAXON_ID=265536 /ORGANISM="Amphiprora sp., Strain CCMP467" /LENGTH=682 /DNA_ID=CAMNT_0008772897 /DNA_START=331 /DNA_END=2379 /DNA_ORIENTATION=+